MTLRPGRTTRKIKRPYTRTSRTKPRKSYVVGVPFPKIHIFDMGNAKKQYDSKLWLVVDGSVQLRDNCLEAARVVANKLLEKAIADNYSLKVLVYPHQILREHSMASGAGADRFSSGMSHSFGKPSGLAAIVKRDQSIMLLKLNKKDLVIGRKALKRASSKLPITCRIIVE